MTKKNANNATPEPTTTDFSVVDLLVSTLESLNYPVFLQGTFCGENYPSTFITYFVDSYEDLTHYDDDAKSWTFAATVIVYSNDPANLFSVPATVRTTLKNAGFIPAGKGYNIFSDDPNFTGWTNQYLFLDK